LQPLAAPDNPWSGLAQEQLAILDLRQGKLGDARKMLLTLSTSLESPPGLRARANALLVGFGPQEAK
jgi:hypothetical protein